MLFRLTLEKGSTGSTYHAVAEQGIPRKMIMTVVGKCLSLPIEGKPMPQAVEALGFFAHVISLDNPTSSEKA